MMCSWKSRFRYCRICHSQNELTLDAAGRWADYSTVGGTESWKANLVWAPIDDVAFRGGRSKAVRAPNVTELFGPETGINFRPIDPCDAAQIGGIAADNPTWRRISRGTVSPTYSP